MANSKAWEQATSISEIGEWMVREWLDRISPGIVYSPQEIVDFMCASVAEVLDKEFGLTLGSPGYGGINHVGGEYFSQLTGNLSGTLKVEAKDGAVPVDFARLATGSTPISAEGWSRDGVTAFDQLDADCKFGSGHVWCQSLSMQTSQGSISGSGDIDLTKQTIDWNLTVTNRIVPERTSQLTQGEAPKVSIRGSLAQPTIRRADRPTLGEGSLPASPAAPQVSPH
jgi:hypothetical protein